MSHGTREARHATVLLSLAALVLLGACSNAPTHIPTSVSTEPVPGDWVIARLDAGPTTFNWAEANDRPTRQVGRLVAESLVAVGRDLTYGPRLATHWSFSNEGKTLTFRLRQDVRFHDGEAFTSDDVLFTYERAVDPEGGNAIAAYFTDVEAVRAPDAHTLVVQYRQAVVTALQGWERLLILPRHRWEGIGPMEGLDVEMATGTGPFRLKEWKTGAEVVLVANDDYWGARPHLDRIVFRIIKDETTAFAALRARDIDMTPVSSASWPTARTLPEDGRLRFLRFQLLHLVYIAWNGDGSNPFFTDPRVRRAMTHAIDREGFIKSVLNGLGQVATSTFVPGTWAHDPAMQPLPYDMQAAAQLLEEAGWTDRDGDGTRDRDGVAFRFTLNYYNTNPNSRNMAEMLQASLGELEVDVTLRPVERAAFLSELRGHQYQAQISSWALDTDPDPFDFWHSTQIPTGWNYTSYADEEIDLLCEKGRREFEPVARAALYSQVQQLLQRDQPYTFLYHIERVVGMDRRIQGVEANSQGIWNWYPSVLQWWVPTELQRFAREAVPGATGG